MKLERFKAAANSRLRLFFNKGTASAGQQEPQNRGRALAPANF
jgi:hypothetical protein